MNRKLLAIISALLISASLCACAENREEDTTDTNKIDISNNETGTGEKETDEQGSQINPPVVDKAPGELEYTAKDGKVYILHENGAVNLRNADGSVFKSFDNGTEFERIAVSKDGEWTKVKYEDKEYYVVTSCITDLRDLDEGFAKVEKTLKLKTAALSIRMSPETTGRVVGYYNEGDEVKVIAENTTTGWYKVEFTAYGGETTIGYVASDAKYYETDETTEETTTASEETTASTEESTTAGK